MRSRLAAVLGVVVLGSLATAAAAAADPGFTTTLGRAAPRAGVLTIPYFSDSFSLGGVTYPYYMVGTNPRTSDSTTIVPTVIVPLRLVFADGHVSDPGNVAASVSSSPVFTPAAFSSGLTQYGDAVRRAMFWQYDATSAYHVLLGRPVVLPTVTLHVPAGDGVFLHAGDASGPPALGLHVAVDTGVVSTTWFYSEFASLVGRLSPRALPIVLSRNVALSTDPIPYGSPTLGFHAAFARSDGSAERIETAIWADYADPNAVIELGGILHNTDVLSHEVSEWLHDPFLNNTVPSWLSPDPLSALVYGCTSLLETSDPTSLVAGSANGYQLSDAAFLSWFAHQVPSIGINGQYSFFGELAAPSPLC